MIAFFLVVGIGLGIGLLSRRPHQEKRPRFTIELCEEICSGMTMDHVIEIIGCSPGDYRTRPESYLQGSTGHWYVRSECWIGDEGQILIELDQEDRVTTVMFFRFKSVRKRGWPGRIVDALMHQPEKNPKDR
jgi:hypothetical protein